MQLGAPLARHAFVSNVTDESVFESIGRVGPSPLLQAGKTGRGKFPQSLREHSLRAICDGGEFRIAVRADGRWIGTVTSVGGECVLMFRTFVGAD